MPDAPIPEDLVEIMKDLGRMVAKAIDDEAGGPMGFMLMVFDFGEGGTTSYISNARREDVVKTLQEFIEKHPDDGSVR